MNDRFPVKPCWNLAPVPSKKLSATNSALSWILQRLQYMPHEETQPTTLGMSGTPSAKNYVMTHSSKNLMIQFPSFKSLPTIHQMLTTLGSPDPRLQPSGTLDLHLS
jgi:hypothetical protein